MIDWFMEQTWLIEAVLTIAGAFILARILCVLADLMDRD